MPLPGGAEVLPSASALLADEDGIEQLIERLEDLSDESGWDA